MDATFDYAPDTAREALARMAAAEGRGPRVLLGGSDLAQAQMGALVSAEWLAAEAGIVPFITLEDGTQAVYPIGGARARIRSASGPVSTLYLATHQIARRGVASAVPVVSPLGSDVDLGDMTPIGVLPIVYVVALTVVAVAGIVAAAWYAQSTTTGVVGIASDHVVNLAKVDGANRIATEELRKNGRISSDTAALFQTVSHAEGGSGIWPYVAGGAAIVGLAGGLYMGVRHAPRLGR